MGLDNPTSEEKQQELVALIIKAQDFCNDGHTD